MVNHIIRIIFCLSIIGMTLSYALRPVIAEKGSSHIMTWVLIPILVAVATVFVDMFWRRKRINVLSGLFFGILSGLAIAFALSKLVDLGTALFDTPPAVAHPGPAPHMPAPPWNIEIGDEPATRPAGAAQSNTGGAHPGAALSPDIGGEFDTAEEYLAAWKHKKKYDEQLAKYKAHKRFTEKVYLIKMLMGAFSIFICVTVIMQTKDEFRFIIPYVEFSKQTKGTMPLLLDTSVIIDGRIADILATKIIQSELIVPRFVLGELQTVADSHDKLKRNRGRRGLDILQELQSTPDVEIEIVDVSTPNIDNAPDVDTKLIAIAQHLNARIMTNDYNLNKLASVRGIDVININDLTNALKPIVLPGEEMSINLIRPGESPEQGVGYLDDGTMVVVEEGRNHIGSNVLIKVTSAIQTSAGRMIFGRYIREIDKTKERDENETS